MDSDKPHIYYRNGRWQYVLAGFARNSINVSAQVFCIALNCGISPKRVMQRMPTPFFARAQ